MPHIVSEKAQKVRGKKAPPPRPLLPRPAQEDAMLRVTSGRGNPPSMLRMALLSGVHLGEREEKWIHSVRPVMRGGAIF